MKRTGLAMLGSAVALVACSSSSSRPATPEEYDDTAQAIGATVVVGGGGGDVASMADAVEIAFGVIPSGFTRTGDGHMRCRRFGLEISYMLTCKDAAGTVLARCGASTDEATVDVAWSGDLDTENFDAMVSRIGTWTLTGLQSKTATFSGLSAFSFTSTLTSIFRPGVTASYELDTASAYNAIRIDTKDREIIDGSAIFDVSAHRVVTGTKHDVDASFDIHADLTFHGDNTASLVLDGTRHYLINLRTGRITRVD